MWLGMSAQNFCNFATGKWFDIFSSAWPMFGRHQEGLGRTTPNFYLLFIYKIITRKRMNIFTWFLLHRVDCGPKYFWKFCRACRTTQKGVAGPHPFFIKKIITRKLMNICPWFLLHRVGCGPKYIFFKFRACRTTQKGVPGPHPFFI